MQTITNSENASPEQQDRFVIVHTHAMQNKGKRRGTWTAKEKIHNTTQEENKTDQRHHSVWLCITSMPHRI